MFKTSLKYKYTHIPCLFATCFGRIGQHISKESTALCTRSNSTLKYVVVVSVINFGVTGCFFSPIFYIAGALCPIGCAAP
jgi:hypothetical protein